MDALLWITGLQRAGVGHVPDIPTYREPGLLSLPLRRGAIRTHAITYPHSRHYHTQREALWLSRKKRIESRLLLLHTRRAKNVT